MSYACRSVNDIKANQERLKEILKSYEKIRRDKTEDVIRDILERDFPKKNLSEDLMGLGAEAEDHRREAAQDVLSRGIEDVQKNYRQAKKEALETWGDLIGVAPYLEYKPQGTAVIETNEGSGWESKRISNNEAWYRDFYKENKKAPTQRQRYDIAHEEFMKEFEEQARNDPEAEEALKEAEAAKARVEALEELDGYFKSLDVRDILARKTLSEDAYRNVYLPMIEALRGANSAVLEASQDSALVYARMLDVAAKKYSTPDHPITARDLAARIVVGSGYAGKDAYLQTTPEGKKLDRNELNVTELTGDEFGPYADIKSLRKKAVGYYAEHLQGHSARNEILGSIVFETDDSVRFEASGRKKMENTSAREEKLLAVKHLPEIIAGANTITEAASGKEKHDGQHFYYLHQAIEINGEKKFAVVTVRSIPGTNSLHYYNHNVYTEDEYKKIEGAQNHSDVDRLSTPGGNTEKAPSVSSSIAGEMRIYKSGNIYKQMAGERAEGAPLAKLEEAKAMQASGESETVIWKKTGWMMGKDGKWRWEIPDNMDGIDVSAVRSMKEGDATVLGLIYDNDALYEAYPWLANVFVRAGDLGEKIYGAVREGNRIYINTKSEDVEIKNTLIHEIQHVIQYYEGFAIGGNPASLAGGYREYRNLAGEQEARNTADRAEAVNNAVKAEREAWKKVIDMRSQLEETAKNMDDESKKKILELADTKIDIREKREIPGDEVLDRIDELEAWMKETAPQSVKDAYEAFDDALWDHGGAMNEREWQGKEIPLVHDEDAIVVFGGESMPYSMAGDMTYFQKAWHGSPYSFDRFDLGKIGTGEGFQAHGWGLYFAKDRKIAENYRDVIRLRKKAKDSEYTFKGKPLAKEYHSAAYEIMNGNKEQYLEDMRGRMEALEKSNEAYRKLLKKTPQDERVKTALQKQEERAKDIADKINWAKEANAEDLHFNRPGIYEVEVPENDVLLDEDKPIAEQPPKVRQILENEMRSGEYGGSNGGYFYKDLVRKYKWKGVENPQRAASEHLNKLGIKGITYDGGQDGRCFVVFDDKAVAIIDRFNQEATYGQPMFDVGGRGITTLSAFRKRIEEGDAAGEKVNSKKMTDAHGVVYTEERLRHIIKEHHLTDEELDDIGAHINDLYDVRPSAWKGGNYKGQYHGNVVLAEIYGKTGNYEVALEVAGDGNVYLNTAYKVNKKAEADSKRLSPASGEGVSDGNPASASIQSIRERFAPVNQLQGSRYAGAYNAGENMIQLFGDANQSTIIHESAHMYLNLVEQLAEESEAAAADLKTVREWAQYSEEAMKDYAGTALEKEFREHEARIRSAKTESERRAAEETFMQERFARGFERYLADGSAPTKEMRGVFRRFRDWLTEIYRDIKNLGKADPPEKIRAIFDGMLASKDEIEAWAAERQLGEIRKQGYDFTKNEEENIRKMAEDVKEKAKDSIMKDLQKSYTESMRKTVNDLLDSMKEDFQRQLMEENPVYKVEEVCNRVPFVTQDQKREYLRTMGYESVEAFQNALAEAGGPMEKRTADYLREQRKGMEESMLSEEAVRAAAEDAFHTPQGQARLALVQAAAMRRKLSAMIRQIAAAQIALNGEKANVYDIRKKLNLLTKEEIEKHESADREARLRAENKLLREKVKETETELREKMERQKEQSETEKQKLRNELREKMEGIKQSRRALDVSMRDLYRDVKEQLEEEKVSDAVNWKWWDKKARQAEIAADREFEKQHWDSAGMAKKDHILYAAMAGAAKKNEQFIRAALAGNPSLTSPETDIDGMERYGLLGMLNRIGRKEKPVLMENSGRYFLQHMAYQLGLSKRDAEPPLGDDGQPMPVDRERIYDWLCESLDTNRMMELDTAFPKERIVAPWIMEIYGRKEKTPYTNLTMAQFRDIVQAMKIVYRLSRREYEGNTLTADGKQLSFDEAAKIIIGKDGYGKRNKIQEANDETAKDRVKKYANKILLELTQPEVIMERMGEDVRAVLYDPIARAQIREDTLMEEANKKAAAIYGMYTQKEWRQMRNDRIYGLGYYGRFTKEQILCMALNWGTETNRDRIKRAYGTPTKQLMDSDVEDMFSQALDDRDWDFVEAVWEHINSYYKERSLVQQRMIGVPMGKVPGLQFTIGGRTIRGQYYPLKYDKKLSDKARDNEINDIVKTEMAGPAPFSIGMGSTKTRARFVKDLVPDLSLTVYEKAVKEAIHHIAMREAATDVYKLLTREDVADAVKMRVGEDSYDILKHWAADCWQSPIDRMGAWGKVMETLRKNTVFAIMAGRMSVACLNLANAAQMCVTMGPKDTLRSIASFWYPGNGISGIRENIDFVLGKSVMMRQRSSNMDRDMEHGLRIPADKNTSKTKMNVIDKPVELAERAGYTLISYTDLMFSMAQWKYVYEQEAARQMKKGADAKQIEEAAILAADRAVRRTFGSGQMKDLPDVQKRGFLKHFLPFYSYSSTVMNQFIRGAYRAYDRKDYGYLLHAVAYGYILNAVIEAGIYAITGDKDDKLDYFLKRLKYSAVNSSPVQGVPVLRDLFSYEAGNLSGVYAGDPVDVPLYADIFEQTARIQQYAASKNKDWTDVGKQVSRVGNRIVRFPDTVTDGIWGFLRFVFTDTDAAWTDLISGILFDRRVESEREKKKRGAD